MNVFLFVVIAILTIAAICLFAKVISKTSIISSFLPGRTGSTAPSGWKLSDHKQLFTWLGVLAGVAVVAIFWKPILNALFPALSTAYHATDGLGTMTWFIGLTMVVMAATFAAKKVRESKEWWITYIVILASLFIIAGILKGFDDRLGLTLIDLMGSAKFWLVIGVTACVWVYYKYPSHKGLKRAMLALILVIIFWIIPGAIGSNPKVRAIKVLNTDIGRSHAEHAKEVAVYETDQLRWLYNVEIPAGFDKYGRFLSQKVTNDLSFIKLDNRDCRLVIRDRATGDCSFFEGSMRAINIWRGYWRDEKGGKLGWFELKDRGYPYMGHFRMVIAHEETGDAFPGYVRSKTRRELDQLASRNLQ